MSEILASLEGTTYIERVAVNSAQNILRAKKAVKKAFQYQMDGAGFNMIEVLSQCPTNWKMNTVDACRWIDEVMSKTFPIGVIKDAGKGQKDAD
jgi:2-oxoglutarate ferredoxin oxidoreductase subunit beta